MTQQTDKTRRVYSLLLYTPLTEFLRNEARQHELQPDEILSALLNRQYYLLQAANKIYQLTYDVKYSLGQTAEEMPIIENPVTVSKAVLQGFLEYIRIVEVATLEMHGIETSWLELEDKKQLPAIYFMLKKYLDK